MAPDLRRHVHGRVRRGAGHRRWRTRHGGAVARSATGAIATRAAVGRAARRAVRRTTGAATGAATGAPTAAGASTGASTGAATGAASAARAASAAAVLGGADGVDAVARSRSGVVPAAVSAALAAARGAGDPVARFPFRAGDGAPVPAAAEDLQLEIDGLRPGPELARLLTEIDPARASDGMLVDMVAAAERLAAWARASSAALAAELSRRPAMRPDSSRSRGALAPVESTATELGARLACSPFAAARLTRMGRALAGPLTATGAAFANGRLDERRAQVITDALEDVPGPVVWEVEDRVLERAASCTVAEVRADVQRALVAVDPVEAQARVRRARSTRRVEAPRRETDGMATLIAVLAAPQAVGVYRVLDTAARTARAAGDPRTLAQLRADGLCDLALGDDVTADPAPPSTDRGCRDVATAQSPTDLSSGCERSATTRPSADATNASTGTADATPEGLGARSGSAASEAPGAPGGSNAPSRTRASRRCPTVVTRVTMPLSTLLGMDDQPADLEGYGAIDPVTARALAAGGVFQRMVTDPLSGSLLDLGRTTYRPSAALAEHVQARDGTCRHPACSVPATSCDLDHTRDYHREPADGGPPGTTSHDNLGSLCRRHHRMKSEAGFRLRQSAPGRFEWLTPTGHRYVVHADPVAPPPIDPSLDDPPPF